MDSGILNDVEIGQYFMTKDTGDLTQFNTVACCEYTLIGSCNQLFAWNVWSRDQNLVREQGQYSLLGQNFPWIKQVCDEFEQRFHRIPEDQLEKYALKLSAKDFACRAKAKAKPQRIEPSGSSPRNSSY